MPETPPQTPPRLESTSETDYAPISWTAVASLAVAGLYCLILAVMLGFLRRGQPLIEQWLFVFPVLAIVLAFVARRQIRASEGTRTGERYANLGWWLAMVGGIGYVAYLVGVDYAVRRDAQQQFQAWADNLTDLNPAALNDAKFYSALYLTLPPGARSGMNPKDGTGIERLAGQEAVAFRQLDLVRLCARNRGQAQIRPSGLRDWQQKPTEITATLTGTLITPEGEYGLVVPMRAVVDENKTRRWQIMAPAEGLVKSATLTRYGWRVRSLEVDGITFIREFLGRSSAPNSGAVVYLGYVQPGGNPQSAAAALAASSGQAEARAAAAGNLTRPEASRPLPPDWKTVLTDRVFGLPNGGKLPADQAQRLLAFWQSGGRLMPAGTLSKMNPDKNPMLILPTDGGPGTIQLRFPIEVGIGESMTAPAAARGAVVAQVSTSDIPALAAELAAGRAATGSPRTTTPPDDMITLPRLPWRVTRLESDMRPIPMQAQSAPGG